ncbi:MAG: ABC transporter substrate-binding protein, partial [Acidimicrobiales bacterium]
MPPIPRRRAPAVLATAALVVSAACSGGGGGSGGGDAGPEGPARAATGAPLRLGLINQENAAVGSFPELRRGAQAAVRYVNQRLGGVGGRPIVLSVCTTNGSPESSQACANQVLEAKPVAVLGGLDLGAASSLRVFAKTGVAYVGGSPTLGAELTSSAAFMFSGGTAADLLGQLDYILGTLKAKRASFIYLDLGGLTSAVAKVAQRVLEKKGLDSVKLVATRSDAPDFTPVVTAATRSKPDVIVVALPAQGCARVMQAAKALGVKARIFYPGACAEQQVIEGAGGGAEGAYFATGYLPYNAADAPNVAVYRRELKRSDAGRPSLLSETGFSLVMDLRSVLEGIEAPITAASVMAAVKATRGQASFLGHAFTCDGRQ